MRLSIVTITYNAEATLERTLLSVKGQTDSRYEYILVDGASKDGTMSIVESYRRLFSKVVSEPDGGLYYAMNKGLAMATGDYVCFLNAGDKFHDSRAVETILSVAGNAGMPDIIYGETDIVDDNGNFLYHRRLKVPAHLDWRSFENGMLVCHQAFVVKREKTVQYDTVYRYSADYDWCIRCMKRSGTSVNTGTVLVDYLAEGVTTANRNASLKERFLIMAKNYGLAKVLLNHVWFAFRFGWAKIRGKM